MLVVKEMHDKIASSFLGLRLSKAREQVPARVG
jgi:hypothetical protein